MKRPSGRSGLEVPVDSVNGTRDAMTKLPDWYRAGPFLYDTRVMVFSVASIVFVLMLTGELLITVLAVGSLVIHLIDNVGAKRQAVTGYLCVFIIAELTVVYSAIPLLWLSLYNVIMLFALNAFIVFTGGWVLIHFDAFLQEEPSLSTFIETSLFSFYPSICILIMSWMVSQATSVFTLPYSIIVFGFLALQLFLPQKPSSFYKSRLKQPVSNILSPIEACSLLTLYIVVPAQIFIFINFWELLLLRVILKLIFVIVCPIFLITVVDVHYVIEYSGISLKQKTRIRWAAGVTSLSLILALCYLDNLVSTGMLPWLPAVFLVNLLLGVFMSRKTSGKTIIILALACVCCILYYCIISSILPIDLEVGGVSVKILWLLLICNATLIVVCVLAAATSNKERLSDALLCHIIVMVFTEHQLFSIGLYSQIMFFITMFLEAYMLSRLQYAGKVSWYSGWLSLGIHATKFPVILQNQLKLDHIPNIGSSPLTEKLFTALFVLSVSRLFLFESRKSVPVKHAIAYAFSISFMSILSMNCLVQPLFVMITQSDPNTANSLALFLITSGTLLLKLTLCHMTKIQDAKILNLIAIVLASLIFILQPSSEKTFVNLCNVLLLLPFPAGVVLFLTRSSRSRPLYLDIVYSVAIGFPVGLKAFQLLVGSQQIIMMHIVLYLFACSITTFILITASLWSPFAKKKRLNTSLIPSATIVLAITCMTLFFIEFQHLSHLYVDSSIGVIANSRYALPCTKLFACIFLSICINLRIMLAKIASDDPFGAVFPSLLPCSNNLATIAAYGLLLLNYPPEVLPEIWACVCSFLFLFLTNDNFMFSRITRIRKSGIVFSTCVFILYLATVYENDIWRKGPSLRTIVELIICLAISPVFFSLCCFVLNRFYVIPIKRIVFLSPLCIVLPVFGSSYASWILGTLGLTAVLGSSLYTAPSVS